MIPGFLWRNGIFIRELSSSFYIPSADVQAGRCYFRNVSAQQPVYEGGTETELRLYQEVTLHHSSLSTCIFGILASEIGYQEEAYEYFSQSARMDLDDYHNNFYAGIHAANMAGTWLAIVNGFAGLRTNAGDACVSPLCTKRLERIYLPDSIPGQRTGSRHDKGSVQIYVNQRLRIRTVCKWKENKINRKGGKLL